MQLINKFWFWKLGVEVKELDKNDTVWIKEKNPFLTVGFLGKMS